MQMLVGLSVGPKTEFEFLALRPFSLSKLALIDADEDDDEEDDDDDDEEEDDDDDEKDVKMQLIKQLQLGQLMDWSI